MAFSRFCQESKTFPSSMKNLHEETAEFKKKQTTAEVAKSVCEKQSQFQGIKTFVILLFLLTT